MNWDPVELIAVLNTGIAAECGVHRDTSAAFDERPCEIVPLVSDPDDGTASPE